MFESSDDDDDDVSNADNDDADDDDDDDDADDDDVGKSVSSSHWHEACCLCGENRAMRCWTFPASNLSRTPPSSQAPPAIPPLLLLVANSYLVN